MVTITVANFHNVFDYPPVISLLHCLLDIGCKVNFVSYDVDKLPNSILDNPRFSYASVDSFDYKGIRGKFKKKYNNITFARKNVCKFMKSSDFLWTTTDSTVRYLGKIVFEYKHIMQLMELIPNKYLSIDCGLLKFPISNYAEKAYRVVVPEINRAYIQKALWNLKITPKVLPNKPYCFQEVNECSIDNVTNEMLMKIKNDHRKIILYLGVIGPDRNLKSYAEAIYHMGPDYCLYILGRALDSSSQDELDKLIKEYECVEYLGYVRSPAHLLFIKYAYIGLLPYIITNEIKNISILNSLYCAPNKIFEYAKFGLPMVGTDVLGLKIPFEKYKIGVCADDDTPMSILEAIRIVDLEHDKMSQNCKSYFNEIDYSNVVEEILL